MGTSVAAPRAQAEGSRADKLWAELLARTARGDRRAVAEFYDVTVRNVFGLVLHTLGDYASAEEVTLDIYVQVWKQAGRYNPERGSASSWLLNIARGLAIDRLQSRGRGQRTRKGPPDAVGEVPACTATPAQNSVLPERQPALPAAMGALQAPQREAIELAYFSGFSHSQIAERLGEPLDTVKTRIRLGMVRLRESLQPQVGAL